MIDEIEYEEIDAACFDDFDTLEVEVVAAAHQADCHDHSGCTGCFLLPIFLSVIAGLGILAFFI